jgi:hypothetical protein
LKISFKKVYTYVLKLCNAVFKKQRLEWKGRIKEIVIIRYRMKFHCDLAVFKGDWMGINYFKNNRLLMKFFGMNRKNIIFNSFTYAKPIYYIVYFVNPLFKNTISLIKNVNSYKFTLPPASDDNFYIKFLNRCCDYHYFFKIFISLVFKK